MKVKYYLLWALIGAFPVWVSAHEPGRTGISGEDKAAFPYKDATLPVEERVEDLLGRMTWEEKILQLNQYTLGNNDNVNNIEEETVKVPAGIGSLIYFSENPELRNGMQRRAMEETRLGIPILFGYDVIHGFRTVYPISLAQACSWNTELVGQACGMAAEEARRSGVDWTFSPMIDVARDGRWGRISEGYGEDPYANAAFCVASVKGYQGDDLTSDRQVAACLKHYVGYGASEAGLDYVYTEISRQTLWDTYLPPYEAGVKAGAMTVMSSFNDISGVPATCNHYTLTEVLKERWGLDGFVVSDWNAVAQLIPQGVAADRKEAARLAMNAGLDMDMVGHCYDKHLEELLREGAVSEERVNEAVRRVLRLKFRLGLFERPYTEEVSAEERLLRPQSRALAERLAEEAIVLLKNEGNILPLRNLNAGTDTIAVMGPLVDASGELLGNWSAHGRMEEVGPIREALQEEFEGKATLLFHAGCPFDGEDESGFAGALDAARRAKVVVLFMGEKRMWSGENCVRSAIELPAVQEKFIRKIKEAGKPVVLVLASGRPLGLHRVEPLCDAMVEMWQPGIPGGRPVAGVLSGRVNPSGKLCVTFPRTTGQIPVYYNRRQSSRPTLGLYQDIPSTPLYEFGHGLSYTTYQYGDIRLSKEKAGENETLTAEVSVTNTGDRAGAETVHWFITDPYCRVSRPVRELKHFEKQLIQPGETKIFRFEIDPKRDLSFVDSEGKRFLEAGVYYIRVKDRRATLEIVRSGRK